MCCDMLAAMFEAAASFRCMMCFHMLDECYGFLMCIWLSFALWIDMYACLGIKMSCYMLDL